MTTFRELLNTARAVRKQLKASRNYQTASIRDAITLAVDNILQLDAERVNDDEPSEVVRKSELHTYA